ncbi:MAG: hypothetical protein U0992_16840 [Planctomycetaceae bacterium]
MHFDAEMESRIVGATNAIRSADALLIGAGAGMGVDSGLSDFRGPEGFWNAYPAFRGREFYDISTPRLFDEDRSGLGLLGHRLNLYRSTTPHAGFGIVRLGRAVSAGLVGVHEQCRWPIPEGGLSGEAASRMPARFITRNARRDAASRTGPPVTSTSTSTKDNQRPFSVADPRALRQRPVLSCSTTASGTRLATANSKPATEAGSVGLNDGESWH